MIYIGTEPDHKARLVHDYCLHHDIEKVFWFTPGKFVVDPVGESDEVIGWDEIILYEFYYRLLQEIHHKVLLVINEPLRTKNRNDLTYNCLRNFLNQTKHQIIFSYLPLIETLNETAILFDLDTRSQWKRMHPERLPWCEADFYVRPHSVNICSVDVPTSVKTREAYHKKKRDLIDNLGLKDPHTIPRNLYLVSGRDKREAVQPGRWHVGRNNRFKIASMATYREETFPNAPYTIFEFPHDHLRLADFVTLSGQHDLKVLTCDIKVDAWYLERFQTWAGRIDDAYAAIS